MSSGHDPEYISDDETMEILFEKFGHLKKAHHDFDNFLEAVSEDLAAKLDGLKRMSHNDHARISVRTDASLQVFMLSQYSHRVDRFRTVAASSLINMSRKLAQGEEVEPMVTKHMAIIEKMKRRMKNMIDVAEIHVVEDIMININLLQQMAETIGLSAIENEDCGIKALNRRCRSMSNLVSESSEDSLSNGSSMSSSPPNLPQITMAGDLWYERRKKTLKILTDHVAVLTKSYINRK